MSFASNAAREAPMADINITPLVDVMLVLLIIFMIATPTLTRALAMDLPQPTPKSAETPSLHLGIGAGDVYALEGEAVSRAELARRLGQALASDGPTLKLEIAADPEAEYESVTRALATARNAGVENLAFVDR